MIFSLNSLRAESLLLSVMACDRLAAIRKALHTGTLLGGRACVHTAAAALGQGLLSPAAPGSVELKPGAKPLRQNQYPMKLESWLGLEPRSHNWPKTGVVAKPHAQEQHVVQHLRAVNQIAIDQHPVLPNPPALLTATGDSNVCFTALDLEGAFFGVLIVCPRPCVAGATTALFSVGPEPQSNPERAGTRSLPEGVAVADIASEDCAACAFPCAACRKVGTAGLGLASLACPSLLACPRPSKECLFKSQARACCL